MTRIAHVLSTPAGLGGAEMLVADLARHSAARGDVVVVLNAFESADMGTSLRERCDPVPVRSSYADGVRRPWSVRSWLKEQLREARPDVVHVHLARALVLVASLRREAGSSTVLTHHHGDQFLTEGRSLAVALERLAGRRYDRVVAVSPAVAAVVVDRLSYPADRVRLIRNGWTGSPLPRAVDVPPRVVCVGRLRREKGHDVLLEAFAALRHDVPGVVLDLVGDGPEREPLTARAQGLGIRDGVVFHGDVRDVWPILARASVAVQPSRSETFGIAALEAMAAGVPVVATAVGGLVDVVDHESNGLLVPVGDPPALARGLQRVLRDDALAHRLARAGGDRAQSLRREAALGQYDELYEALTAAAPGGR